MNLVEVLDELHIPHASADESHHVTSAWYGIDCPSCSPNSGRYKLGINANGYASCWSCGRLKLTDVLIELSGEPYHIIRKLLDGLPREHIRREERPRGKLVLPPCLGPLLKPHRQYLKGRGFDPDELQRLWGLQGIGLAPRLAWRVFLPIHHKGEVVSWTTRAIVDDVERRYVNAKTEEEVISAKSVVMGLDYVRHAAVVVEGPMDAYRIGPGTVATMGVSYSQAQVRLLSKIPVRVIVFDSETKAQQRAKTLCNDLSAFPGKTVRIELDSADPGEASKREVRLLRKAYLE